MMDRELGSKLPNSTIVTAFIVSLDAVLGFRLHRALVLPSSISFYFLHLG